MVSNGLWASVYLGELDFEPGLMDPSDSSAARPLMGLPFQGDFPMAGELLIESDFGARSFHLRLDGAWHILQTRVRAEKALSLELSALGLGNVLPVTCQERYFGRRRAVVEVPIFPGLVFLRGSEADLELACQTMRVLQTIKVADQESLSWTLDNLEMLSERSVNLSACGPLNGGRRAEISSGLLRGIQGLVGATGDQLVFQVQGSLAAASVQLGDESLRFVV